MAMKDTIFKADDRPVAKWEDVPEWGVKVGFRVLSGSQRSDYEGMAMRSSKGGEVVSTIGLRETLLVATLVDEEGVAIFTKADIAKLGGKNGDVLDRLFDIGKEVSKLDGNAVADAEKNSESG